MQNQCNKVNDMKFLFRKQIRKVHFKTWDGNTFIFHTATKYWRQVKEMDRICRVLEPKETWKQTVLRKILGNPITATLLYLAYLMGDSTL